MRGLRSTIVLFVVLAGLGAYIYFVTARQPDEGASTLEKLFELETADVQELKLKAESGDVTTLRKESGAWRVVDPVAAPASEPEVSGVLSSLEQLEIVRVVDEKPAALSEYGLEAPRIEVDYKAGEKSGKLSVGAKTPTGANLYARRNDEPRVLLVAASQEAALNKSTFDLRDKAIMKLDREKIDHVEVTLAANKTIQLRKEGTDWKLAAPVAARADSGTVEALIGRIESAQMKSIVTEQATPEDLRKYGLDKPRIGVAIGQGSARAQFLVGGKADDTSVYAKDASKPAIVTVESAIAEDLGKEAVDYRRRDVFEFRAFNATRAEFTRAGQTAVFERVKGAGENAADSWKRVSPSAGDVDLTKMDTLLAGLADIRATSFAETTSGTGLNDPVLTVVVKFEEGKKEERVSFGKSGQDAHASLAAGETGAARIEAEKLDEAIKALEELSK